MFSGGGVRLGDGRYLPLYASRCCDNQDLRWCTQDTRRIEVEGRRLWMRLEVRREDKLWVCASVCPGCICTCNVFRVFFRALGERGESEEEWEGEGEGWRGVVV